MIIFCHEGIEIKITMKYHFKGTSMAYFFKKRKNNVLLRLQRNWNSNTLLAVM